jgi:hypothetical protein
LASKVPKPLPIQGVKIPDLPPGGWQVAVSQWESPDAAALADMGGIALKDWPEDWYKGVNKTTYAAKRGQRELIARGYAECVTAFSYLLYNDGQSCVFAAAIAILKSLKRRSRPRVSESCLWLCESSIPLRGRARMACQRLVFRNEDFTFQYLCCFVDTFVALSLITIRDHLYLVVSLSLAVHRAECLLRKSDHLG